FHRAGILKPTGRDDQRSDPEIRGFREHVDRGHSRNGKYRDVHVPIHRRDRRSAGKPRDFLVARIDRWDASRETHVLEIADYPEAQTVLTWRRPDHSDTAGVKKCFDTAGHAASDQYGS